MDSNKPPQTPSSTIPSSVPRSQLQHIQTAIEILDQLEIKLEQGYFFALRAHLNHLSLKALSLSRPRLTAAERERGVK